MNKKQEKALRAFADEYGFLKQKGALCVALVGTRKAKEKGLPLDPESMKTPRKGQVSGLSKGAVQNILKDYGIHRILAKEGGRTSRGSLDNMNRYLHFLNKINTENPLQLAEVERFWIDMFGIEQFMAANIYEIGKFRTKGHQSAIVKLLEVYNSIIEEVETDPSLKIEY